MGAGEVSVVKAPEALLQIAAGPSLAQPVADFHEADVC